jgi:hypothetical protein
MMLDDKSAVKPERLGFDVVFDKITKSFAAVEFAAAAPRCGAAEQAELHCSNFPSGGQFTDEIIATDNFSKCLS